MAEPFSEIEKSLTAKASLGERLREYPKLKAKMERLLGIIENAGRDIEKAAEAERRIIEELRQMRNEVLHGWARRQQHKKEQEYKPSRASIGRKKTLWYTRLGKIEIGEEIFTQGRRGPEIRPCGGCQCSRPRCSGSRLLSLYLQPLEFPGLQRRFGRWSADRFR
jgi:hypothetical protein